MYAMNRILVGNIVALISSLLMIYIGFLKDKKSILVYQIVNYGILGISNVILGGISGLISNILSIARNVICLKYDFNTKFKILFLVIQALFTFIWNREGIFGILPFVAVTINILFLDAKNIKVFKGSIIASLSLWSIYDFSLRNYIGGTFSVISVITNLVALLSMIRKERQ